MTFQKLCLEYTQTTSSFDEVLKEGKYCVYKKIYNLREPSTQKQIGILVATIMESKSGDDTYSKLHHNYYINKGESVANIYVTFAFKNTNVKDILMNMNKKSSPFVTTDGEIFPQRGRVYLIHHEENPLSVSVEICFE